MDKTKNVYLIGPMGAGKSSVGKLLAKHLDMLFFDTDEEIEKRTGVNLAWIFDVEGEEGFRKREAVVIADLTKLTNIVLATGGGTVMHPDSCKLLRNRGTIVYLEVSLPHQHGRVVNDARRPLLRVKNRDAVLTQLHLEREPVYLTLADFRIMTDHSNVKKVVENIVLWLKENDK